MRVFATARVGVIGPGLNLSRASMTIRHNIVRGRLDAPKGHLRGHARHGPPSRATDPF